MSKNKELKSWREAARLNVRTLKLLYRRYPQLVVSRLLGVAWKSLTPYVGIYLSALLIDELAGARDGGRLALLAGLSLGAAAAVGLGTALLDKWKNAQGRGLWLKTRGIFAEKYLNMDYVQMDRTETAQLYTDIQENQNGGGWGLPRLLEGLEELLAGAATVLGGVSLTVTLFLLPVPESAGAFTVLNNPLFLLAVVAVMAAITLAAPVLSNKAGSYWARNAEFHKLGNRLFGFFGFLGYRRELALDVRMYRQDQFCDAHNKDNTGIFGSKGLFAKLSWGPMGLYRAASAAVSVVFTGVAYVFVCLKAWAGAFGLGAVSQYVASITKVAGGAGKLVAALGDMRNNATFLEEAFAFLDIPNPMYQGSLTVEKRRDRQYQVEFRDVSFKYPGSESYALRHVNMKFQIGRRLAVVGLNGSGKTTFIKLLCRLYDPTEGEILLNGIDIRKYGYEEYMALFSVVFQDFKLFSLKLGENVAASESRDAGRVRDCLEKAGFGERLARLPQGLDTYLYKEFDPNGVDVSGGEGQKIAIARALYKDAPFIVLDEPTAALDPLAEAEIYTKFSEIVGDKTAIYISHRLSSCKFCDEIAVFHRGAVVQQGSHEGLLAEASGMYCRLWNAQAQYYEKEQ